MTSQPPSPPAAGPPDLEDLLRTRLHEVDGLPLPDGHSLDFDEDALRAGRARVDRKRSWTRGLVGVAAAVTIGALVVPAVLSQSSDSDSGNKSAVAGAARSPGDLDGQGLPEGSTAAPEQQPNAESGKDGTGATEPAGQSVQSIVLGLQSQLASTFRDTFTSLVVIQSSTEHRVTLAMTQDNPTALRTVRAALPAGYPVSFVQSAYSAASCADLISRIAGDRSSLAQEGYDVGSTSCDADGRVQLEIVSSVTLAQIQVLQGRYGDTAHVVASVAIP